MSNTIDFTTAIIKNRESLNESIKVSRKDKTQKELNESTEVLTEDTLTEEVDEDIVPEDSSVEEPTEELEKIDDGESFEESIEDDVFFCKTCNKHFLASADTPQDDIICPVCNSDEELVEMGSAQDVLANEENSDVSVDAPEELEEPKDMVEESEELKFNEDDLEEGFKVLAQKYINEKAALRIKEGTITNEGNLVLEGRMLPDKKVFNIVFEGFKQSSNQKKFVLEGTTSLFKGNKLKAIFVREGNTFKVKKIGYGFITESVDGGKQKVKGILG